MTHPLATSAPTGQAGERNFECHGGAMRHCTQLTLISVFLAFFAGCASEETTGNQLGAPAPDNPDTGFREVPNDAPDVSSIATCVDLDGDGYGEGCAAGPDCNDRHRSAHQGATEQCGDALDNDCDGLADEGCGCVEGESVPCYPGAEGTVVQGAVEPVSECAVMANGPMRGIQGADGYSGTDDDCDGALDEGVLNACGQCRPRGRGVRYGRQ